MRKVFITDDSQLYIDTLSGILADSDTVIHSTTESEKAIEKIVEFFPDVILVDYVMPEVCGIELLKRIAEDERISFIPRVLISSNQLREIMDEYDGLFDDYIEKADTAKDIRKHVKICADIGRTRKIIQASKGKS